MHTRPHVPKPLLPHQLRHTDHHDCSDLWRALSTASTMPGSAGAAGGASGSRGGRAPAPVSLLPRRSGGLRCAHGLTVLSISSGCRNRWTQLQMACFQRLFMCCTWAPVSTLGPSVQQMVFARPHRAMCSRAGMRLCSHHPRAFLLATASSSERGASAQ